MVVVRVREVYDLHTVRNKMTLIGIHTPNPQIVKSHWPGLLLNHKFYRPLSANVALACASIQAADPLQVGTVEGEIAPEDLFNPILYKAVSNESYALIESNILRMVHSEGSGNVINGRTATVDTSVNNGVTDEFNAYYGLLADAHGWRHANIQAGLNMTNVRPLVHTVLAEYGGIGTGNPLPNEATNNTATTIQAGTIRGHAVPFPRMPCTQYTTSMASPAADGFPDDTPGNVQTSVPSFRTLCACIVIPPSRLQTLYFRMVVEWNLEFSELRSAVELANWAGLGGAGQTAHWKDYTVPDTTLTKVAGMASSNVEIDKVM